MSEFHRVGVATEKALVLMFVLTLGMKSGLEPDDRSSPGCDMQLSVQQPTYPTYTRQA